MKKRIKLLIPAIVLTLVFVFILVGCMSDEEKAAVGKYNVTTVSVNNQTENVSSYFDHFYIELKENKEYVMSFKYTGMSATGSMGGTWSISDGKVIFKTKEGAMTTVEEYPIKNGVITMTMTQDNDTMTIKFEKENALST